MKTYNQHVFICTNTRNEEQSCGASGALELLKYAKSKATELNLREKGVRISSAGCLGNCKSGPVLVVYPEGTWRSYASNKDIDEVLLSLL